MTSSRATKLCAVISLPLLVVIAASALTSEPKDRGAKIARRSEELSLTSLHNVLEQQAGVIQTLQAQLTSQQAKVASLENTAHMLQTKVNAASTTVAFSARFSADQDSVADGVALVHYQTLVFNQAVTNVGNAYDTSTGIFTAPVAGTYVFFLSVMSTDSHVKNVQIAITKNGYKMDIVFAGGSVDPEDQGSSLVSTHLVKGDRVSCRQVYGDAVRAGYWTTFTGYLLQAQ